MDNNFQTSFIPKKALSEERVAPQRHTSLLSFLATLLFFGSLASAAGMYFYRASLAKEIQSKDASLKAAQNAFEPGFISELKTLDKRITNTNELLQNHIVVSPIFKALEKDTLKSIQFTKFSYSMPTIPGSQMEVHMTGRAKDYTSIALESDRLNDNKQIHDPIFSNLTLDEVTGTVTFDLIFTVDSDLVHYIKHLDEFMVTASNVTDTSLTTDTGDSTTTQTTNSVKTGTGSTVPKSSVPGT